MNDSNNWSSADLSLLTANVGVYSIYDISYVLDRDYLDVLEKCKELGLTVITDAGHFDAGTKERLSVHNAFSQMHRKCYATKNRSYKKVGALGIQVRPEFHNFEYFYNWSVNHDSYVPQKSLKLIRIDNKQDFGPDNCRYTLFTTKEATPRMNEMTMRELYHNSNKAVSYGVFCTRIKRGWEHDKAANMPPNEQDRLMVNGIPFSELYHTYADPDITTYDAAIKRYKSGMDIMKALTMPNLTRKTHRKDENGKRAVTKIEYMGKMWGLVELHRHLQCPCAFSTFKSRLTTLGWDVERACASKGWGKK